MKNHRISKIKRLRKMGFRARMRKKKGRRKLNTDHRAGR